MPHFARPSSIHPQAGTRRRQRAVPAESAQLVLRQSEQPQTASDRGVHSQRRHSRRVLAQGGRGAIRVAGQPAAARRLSAIGCSRCTACATRCAATATATCAASAACSPAPSCSPAIFKAAPTRRPAGRAAFPSTRKSRTNCSATQATRTRFGSLEFGVMVPDRADTWTRMVYAGPNRPIAPIDNPYQMFA